MVVDDHSFQRGVVINMLRAQGFGRIREAANGRQALAVLEDADAGPVDVVLCDLEMPEMDGIEFLRILSDARLARSVVILSGREPEILRSVETMLQGSGLGVLGCLKKPVSIEALGALLSGRNTTMPRTPDPGASAPFLQTDLERALVGDEITAEFQPRVRLADGALMGVEALARWRRPAGGPVPPAAFVPALVRAQLLAALTDRMLQQTCRALRMWDAGALHLTASVNVSMATMSDVGVTDRFVARVRDHQLDPQRITFEVTETEVMADVPSVLNVMARLRLKGFRLAIDDFGTGYSSLSQLNAIPFTELKIDQSFVRGCEGSKRLRDIVESSIDLGQRLGIQTVAEGVETEAEWAFLRDAGCQEAQGFVIAPAMMPAELPGWAKQWRRHWPTPAS